MTTPVGDVEINDETLIWRRVLPDWIHANNDGSFRPKSIAFVDRRTNQLSVHIARLTSVTSALAGRPDDSLVKFRAKTVTDLGLQIVYAPTDDDPSHALIVPGNLTKGQAKALVRASEWVEFRQP